MWEVEFLERLGERVPVLRGRVTTYLDDTDGTLSAHGFVAHMAREMVEVPEVWPEEARRQLVDFLEGEYGVDGAVDELIELWFIEVLVDHGTDVVLGPKLAVEFERCRLGYVVGGPGDTFVRRLAAALPEFEVAFDSPADFLMELALVVAERSGPAKSSSSGSCSGSSRWSWAGTRTLTS